MAASDERNLAMVNQTVVRRIDSWWAVVIVE